MIIKLLLILLSILPAQVALASGSELVFYDSIEMNSKGESVLKGGVYELPESSNKGIQEKAAAVPVDGYYHIRFVADSQSMARAREFADLLLNHPAFASVSGRFRIEYLEGNADLMKCGNNVPQSPRIINCDTQYILSLGTVPVHLTAVFTSRGSGGSGGAVPIVSIDYPLPVMLHEMLHVWTLQDEYTYSDTEAEYYCKSANVLKAPNTSSFATRENYQSDAAALSSHWKDIPWADSIRTPVTTSSATLNGSSLVLGTPLTTAGMEPGLYPGSNCSLKMPSFRPYNVDTIMKTLSTTLIPPIHQKAVLAELARVAGWH
jgi:hypothetical protein